LLGTDQYHRLKAFYTPDESEEPRLSGVGIHLPINSSYFTMPSSYDARWDDKGRQLSDMRKVPSVQIEKKFGVYTYQERFEGFFLHAQCSALLTEFFYPRAIPIARLIDLCRSCHDITGIQDLGYSCKTLGTVDYGNYPWSEFAIESHQNWIEGDLLKIPELEEALHNAQLGKSDEKTIDLKQIQEAIGNCFTKLPPEILGYIMTFMYTNDVKTLSHTCKALKIYIPAELDTSFWASRFQVPFEFGFVFEAQQFKRKLDLRSLYFKIVSAIPKSPGLQSREHIWGFIQSPISELLSLRWNSNPILQPTSEIEDKLRWKEVYGDLRQREGRHPPQYGFKRGCKRFYRQRTLIPTLIHQIVISSIIIGNTSYITGLRFISPKGPEITLGYTAIGDNSSPNFLDQVINATSIQGFIIALGSKGIQALRLVFNLGQLSPWVGYPDGFLKTRRLGNFKSIAALEAGFDVSFYYVVFSLLISHLGI
jgi:hypothetical protein